jgi:predicted RNA binding protein YcfA (HicA-like mRNA interferase family)
MSKLPVVSSRECVKALEKIGFYIDRQKGSHIIMYRDDPYAKTVIPHRKEITKGTLKSILRAAGLTVEEFRDLLD